MIRIPCDPQGVAHWTQRTTFGGRSYVLKFDWNQRMTHWTLAISDQDEVPIATGLVLTSNIPLLGGIVDARRPVGELYIADGQAKDEDAGFSDLGSRFVLLYLDPSELP